MKITYAKQKITDKDINAVKKVLKSDFITQGPTNKKFENSIRKLVGSKFCLTLNTATSALTAACKALDVSKGDIVWTSANSFVASANCAILCGAKVDFIDINLIDYNISIYTLEKKLIEAKNKNKLPKVLIPVHFSGIPCDMKKIHKLSKKFNFKIIEDASHALGASRDNEKVGNCKYSDITVFSFNAVKIITTGEGGCITTNNKNFFEKIKLLRSHGITKEKKFFLNKKFNNQPWYFEQQILGTNYRLSDINSALGISQLKNLKKDRLYRSQLVKNYQQILYKSDFKLIEMPNNVISSHHLFLLFYNFKNFREKIDFFNYLKSRNIFLQVHYIPIYRHPYYQKLRFKSKNFPNTEIYYKNIFSMPLYLSLNKKEQLFVCNQIKKFFKKKISKE